MKKVEKKEKVCPTCKGVGTLPNEKVCRLVKVRQKLFIKFKKYESKNFIPALKFGAKLYPQDTAGLMSMN